MTWMQQLKLNARKCQLKWFGKFSVRVVYVICSALNRMVISLNTYDKSVMFAIQSVHVISRVFNNMVFSLNTYDKSVMFVIQSVHVISRAFNNMVISLNTYDKSVMFAIQCVHVISRVLTTWSSVWTPTINQWCLQFSLFPLKAVAAPERSSV